MVTRDPVIDLARSQPFRLGTLEVDPPRRRVSTGETLEPRVMQVLVALARADGAVVSRDELIRTCWDGRIVGEDSISRVIGALRRLSDDRGGGAFRIETVPKVGYRLVGDVLPVVAPTPGLAAAEPVAGPSKPRWRVPAIVLVVAGAAIAGVAAWTNMGSDDGRVTVEFMGYKPLSDAVSSGLPGAIANATLSAFTEEGRVAVTSGSGGGDFRLVGSIDQVGDVINVASRVENARTGVTLWSRVAAMPAAEQARIATRTAAVTAQLTRCALSQQADHGRQLKDEVLSLLFAECAAEITGDTRDKALDLARRITVAQPDLAGGWSSLAFTANGSSSYGTPPAVAAPLRLEARAAAAKALALDPQDLRAWHVKAHFVPPNDLVGIDRAFQAALRARMSEGGWVYMDYGVFLLSVGRSAKARAMFSRAHDLMPLHGSPFAGLGRVAAGDGRLGEAQEAFKQVDALSSGFLDTSEVLISNSMWTRDYAGALQLMQSHPQKGPPAQIRAIEDGFRALAGGAPEAKRSAAAALLVVGDDCRCNGAFHVRMIAALGDAKGAFDALAALARSNPRAAREAAGWDPVFADVRRQPGFQALAEKLGLVAYWQAMKVSPDFCGSGDAPAVCATLVRATAE